MKYGNILKVKYYRKEKSSWKNNLRIFRKNYNNHNGESK